MSSLSQAQEPKPIDLQSFETAKKTLTTYLPNIITIKTGYNCYECDFTESSLDILMHKKFKKENIEILQNILYESKFITNYFNLNNYKIHHMIGDMVYYFFYRK